MEGKDMEKPSVWDSFSNQKLPCRLVFGYPKRGTTKAKLEMMRQTHMDKMAWVGSLVTTILDDLNQFIQEAAEDVDVCLPVEQALPSPPSASEKYVPHCAGRELQTDAHTPRSDEESCGSEDFIECHPSLASASGDGILEPWAQHPGSSPKSSMARPRIPKGRRLERNCLLRSNV